MLLKTRLLRAASLILVGLISLSAINALAVDQAPVETLLETQTTNIGQAIADPSGAALASRAPAMPGRGAHGCVARRPLYAAAPA
jgi:hypothetical protein